MKISKGLVILVVTIAGMLLISGCIHRPGRHGLGHAPRHLENTLVKKDVMVAMQESDRSAVIAAF
ncbi:MAG: hypothetical protein PF439_10530 [Helicobacteraceae bacterium]|jgi:hypothetical protein|nr:hypothetical protein [Helicobacteraceae bacterium]